MPTAHARIPTDRASRYLAQLCRHLSQLRHGAGPPGRGGGSEAAHDGRQRPQVRHVEWFDTRGTIDLGGGRLTLQASPAALVVTADAPDAQTLGRLCATIANRIQAIGRRDGLAVTWQHAQTPATEPDRAQPPGQPQPPGHDIGGHHGPTVIALVAVAVAVVGLHAAVATAALTAPSWLGWTADAVLVLVGIKLAALVLGGVVLRRRLPHRIPLRRRQP